MRLDRASLLVLSSVLAAACGSGPEATVADTSAESDAGAGGAEGRAGGEPAGTAAPSSATPDEGAAPRVTGPLEFEPQEGWVEETPENPMRVAQFSLPAAEGEAEDASLVVFFFPQGGSVEMNFQRWIGQFEQEDGSDSSAAAVRSERRVAGMPVHQIELSGRFVAETMPGSGVRQDQPGWAMLGAIVEGPDGQYVVKATGPEATIERWRASYERFLSALGC